MSAIDYVVPMVFHDDKLWQEDFKKINETFDVNDYFNFVRFRSWDSEHLLIKCVKKFMPFVRTIYVLLARESQKRVWMDEEGVTVVYHKDFIPSEFLPTFNSCAIEMFLHRIPGISDRFIYGNDDMFPLAPLTEENFFRGDIPCQRFGCKELPKYKNIFHQLCLSEQKFVASEFGIKCDDCLMKGGHGLTPILKKTCEYLWHRGSKEIMESVTPMRKGRNFCQWIYPLWHHFAGNYINKPCQTSYVSTDKDIDVIVSAIRMAKGVLCINDNEELDDYEKYIDIVKKEIENKLNRK